MIQNEEGFLDLSEPWHVMGNLTLDWKVYQWHTVRFWGCDGFIIDTNSTTLDLNGHTVMYKWSMGIWEYGLAGVTVIEKSEVEIKNGTVVDFLYGVWVESSSQVNIHYNIVNRSGKNSIHVLASYRVDITSNKASGSGGFAILLDSNSERVTISKNELSGNNYGIELVSSSNNAVIGNNVKTNSEIGIVLVDSSNNNTIADNNLVNNRLGVYLYKSLYNSVYGNIVAASGWFQEYGIWLRDSLNNSVYGNSISNSYLGVFLESSNYNSVHRNNMSNNGCGISIYRSSENTLKSNSMLNNSYNFGVSGDALPDYINDVDTSNTVDGKQIYYWINKKGVNVPEDAGFVALVNCTNMVAKNLNLRKNLQGILLASTTHSTITANSAANNLYGIYLTASNHNSITANIIAGGRARFSGLDDHGIHLDRSNNCTIAANTIENYFYGVLIESNMNSVLEGNDAHKNSVGFYFNHSSNCTVYRTNARDNGFGIYMTDCDTCTANENIIDNTEHVGIYLEKCTHSLLSKNEVEDGVIGIEVRYSSSITLRENDAKNADLGINILHSSNCTLRDNKMLGNKYNFGVWLDIPYSISQLIHDIDASNEVDSRPIYYLVNQHEQQIPDDAGYVAVINSSRIRIENLYLTRNIQGILLAYSSNCTVQNTITSRNIFGIQLRKSNNCIISESDVSDNDEGIVVDNSDSGIIDRNDLKRNNQFGVHIWASTGNILFHNNLIDNTWQISLTDSINNTWDNGGEGNFWSDYKGLDLNGDGIGDTPYFIDENSQDNFPSMNPYMVAPLFPDLNFDGVVNIIDIVIIAKAFNSKPGDLNWNEIADVDKNGIVNIVDVVKVAKEFGKTAQQQATNEPSIFAFSIFVLCIISIHQMPRTIRRPISYTNSCVCFVTIPQWS